VFAEGRDREFEAACRVPTAFQTSGRSLLEVVRASGFADLRGQFNPRELAEYLRRHPAFIPDWVHYSEDKRTSEGWYLRPPNSVGRIVAYSPSREQHYIDLAAACAAFIVAELSAILDRGAAV